MKRALIAGTTVQGGSYLTESPSANEHDVYGMVPRASTFDTVENSAR
jgi:GDP-D-mannose dehydratase